MQRYFVDESLNIGDQFNCDDDQLKHMKKVMRYRNGTDITVIDINSNVFISEIVDIDTGLIKTKELMNEDHELDVDVTLVYCLPKSDKFELVLQKTTELGVSRIVPMISRRCVVRSDAESFKKKYKRYNKILKEASEQSYRLKIPVLEDLITIKDLNKYLSNINLVAYEESSKQGEKSILSKSLNSEYKSITVIVGPEGGLDQSEIDYMESIGITPCSLGKRILRSETAPIYILSVIGYSRELM